MLNDLNKTMDKDLKEIRRTMYEQIRNVNEEKIMKRKQIEIVWLKSTMA